MDGIDYGGVEVKVLILTTIGWDEIPGLMDSMILMT